ncbi:MAG: arginine--tRNA ligase [Flavobacteriales bacterium]|nr:arginine--tRNA ligase [Flavobacteriales bacterium]MCW8913955.1 arginine--tRNA ligase [Flavobacteriales bacterium]MCW8937768.1 arginine--tRNA ligase [Flavobacteriales bacterium]MCW8940159.1 arginine--tRNA ligase [Flavobacteriales bacterium]MCW8969292.1 arginine--tRNA ligase [Flavobacteriales bacterium]
MCVDIDIKIVVKIQEGLIELYGVDPLVVQFPQKTRKEFDGDLTVVVFPFTKISKKSPEQTAEDLGKYLVDNIPQITNFNVVKGFLNLSIAPEYWLNELNTIAQNKTFGQADPSGKTYMVEYASPNTNKPLHLGHLRNIFLGFSVAEILKANGHEVFKTQIINDRGIHICKSMLAWQKFGNEETPQSSGLKGDHLVGKYYVEFDKAYKKEINQLIEKGLTKEEAEKEAPIFKQAQEMLLKWENGDKEIVDLWKKMNAWVYEGFDVTYQTMGVDFDEIYYESDTYILGKDVVEKGLTEGHFYKKEDGSIWCDLSAEKMDDKLLLRADGTSVYMTQDIGTAIERYKNHPNLNGIIYTVGNEQNHHFKVLFAILKKLGYQWADECHHLSYGMIELPDGKMKSREGTVVDADDLMAEIVNDAKLMTQERGHLDGLSNTEKDELYAQIGLGGLKYYLLKVDAKKGMVFNPEESIDLNGNTAPFIQYAHARIQSLLRKANELNYSTSYTDAELNEEEITLVKLLKDFPTIIKEAGENISPATLSNYIYELVKTFNHFYQNVPILREEDKNKLAMRLVLSQSVANVIASGMKLLGIGVPNKM